MSLHTDEAAGMPSILASPHMRAGCGPAIIRLLGHAAMVTVSFQIGTLTIASSAIGFSRDIVKCFLKLNSSMSMLPTGQLFLVTIMHTLRLGSFLACALALDCG